MLILDIPYRSQRGQGADDHHFDCCMACIAMLDGKISVDEASKISGKARNSFATFGQMKTVLDFVGIENERKFGTQLMLDEIRAQLDNQHPVIALLEYKHIPKDIREDPDFGLGHCVTVVGYNKFGFYVHDPNYTGDGGAYIFWPSSILEKARSDRMSANRQHDGLIIFKQYPILKQI